MYSQGRTVKGSSEHGEYGGPDEILRCCHGRMRSVFEESESGVLRSNSVPFGERNGLFLYTFN